MVREWDIVMVREWDIVMVRAMGYCNG